VYGCESCVETGKLMIQQRAKNQGNDQQRRENFRLMRRCHFNVGSAKEAHNQIECGSYGGNSNDVKKDHSEVGTGKTVQRLEFGVVGTSPQLTVPHPEDCNAVLCCGKWNPETSSCQTERVANGDNTLYRIHNRWTLHLEGISVNFSGSSGSYHFATCAD
jgi:hypothetical protein